MEINTGGRHRGLRLRLVCDPARRALLSELLASRGLGPGEEAALALVERGMVGSEPAALVFDPERIEELPALLDPGVPRRGRGAEHRPPRG